MKEHASTGNNSVNHLRIVHLEDMPADAELVSRALKKAGIGTMILHADNKDAFVKALRDFRPDVIISDHSLPSFNSHEALQIVKEMGVEIPFILVTATVSEEYAVSIIKEGASDYVLKDRLQRLPSAIHNALEKYAAEKALAHERVMQQKLIAQTSIQVQEHERQMIGIELHDNINQILATAKLYVQTIINKEPDPSEFLIRTHECIALAIAEIRKLSHDLVAPSLDKLAFLDAVRDLIEDIHATTALRITLEPGNTRSSDIDKEKGLMFYRIIQEQLTNILKHSRATKAIISFNLTKTETILTITDNGKGFNPDQSTGGIGLKNIKNRAGFYDGKITITSEPGQGCTLRVIIPLKSM